MKNSLQWIFTKIGWLFMFTVGVLVGYGIDLEYPSNVIILFSAGIFVVATMLYQPNHE